MPHFDEIHVENGFAPGSVREIEMHDGSKLRLEKLEEDYDPGDRLRAIERVETAAEKGQVLTGVFYVNTEKPNFIDLLNLDDTPIARLPQSRLRPESAALDEVMEELA